MANITTLIQNIRKAVFGKDVRESIASAIEQTYEDATASGNANMEVSEARGTFGTLNKRLNNSDSVKADKTELTTEASTRQSADSSLQQQINSLASGSPKGSYATVSALVSDNPATGVYVVQADGHLYSWTKDGSNAIDLGVYQAMEVANDSLTLNKLENIIKNRLYNIVSAENLIWRYGTIYNGVLDLGTTTSIISNMFIASAGSILRFSNTYKVRITMYDLSKNYISNSGSYKQMSEYKVPFTGYVIIGLNDSEGISSLQVSNEDVNILGYQLTDDTDIMSSVEMEYKTISNGRESTQYENKRLLSSFIYLPKGAIISLLHIDYWFSIHYYDIDKNWIESSEWTNSTYIIDKTGYIRFTILLNSRNNAKDLTDEDIEKINQIIQITSISNYSTMMPKIDEHIDELKNADKAIQKANNSFCSLNNNGKIYIENISSTGAIDVTFSNNLFVRNNFNGAESSYTIAELHEQLPLNSFLSEDETTITIKIGRYRCLAYDFNTKTWAVKNVDDAYNSYDLIALYNGYCNPTGTLFTLYLSQNMGDLSTIFNSSDYNKNLDWKSKCQEFSALLNETNNIETFLFFTDPHNMRQCRRKWIRYKYAKINRYLTKNL